jgi:hypothetical protein
MTSAQLIAGRGCVGPIATDHEKPDRSQGTFALALSICHDANSPSLLVASREVKRNVTAHWWSRPTLNDRYDCRGRVVEEPAHGAGERG